MSGASPVVENTDENKYPVLALREIAADKIHFDRSVRDALEGKFDGPAVKMDYRRVSQTGPKSIANAPEPLPADSSADGSSPVIG